MRICEVGLGKIGLPLALQYAVKGHRVIGADINARTVHLVNRGVAPFPGEAHLDVLLGELADSGALQATVATTSAVADAEAVVLVVPPLVDEGAQPDFGWMDDATKAVGAGLRPRILVSYPTTMPVGTA